MHRLRSSFLKRILSSPAVGLAVVISIGAVCLWQEMTIGRQLVSLAESDFGVRDQKMTSMVRLFEDHAKFYALVYQAGNSDEGSGSHSSRGIRRMLLESRQALERGFGTSYAGMHSASQDRDGIEHLSDKLGDYYKAMAVALEAVADRSVRADDHIKTVEGKFVLLRDVIAGRLKDARMARLAAAVGQIENFRRLEIALVLFGIFLSLRLLSINHVRSPRFFPSWARLSFCSSDPENILRSCDPSRAAPLMDQGRNAGLLVGKEEPGDTFDGKSNALCAMNDKSLAESERQLLLYKQVFDSTDEAIVITDRNARIIDVNPAYEYKMGYRREELLGQTPAVVSSGVQDKEFYKSMWGSLKKGQCHWSGEIWNKTKEGDVRPFWMTINAVVGADGKASNYICLATDMSERKKAEKELEQLAYFDVLTGLPNRALFDERLRRAIEDAKRRSGRLALMYLDLDRFKEVNDTHGHAIGDALLRQVSDRLTGILRGSDTVSRLGGDEFTVILPEVRDKGSAATIASKIVGLLDRPFDVEGNVISIGGSIGVALFPDEGADAETIKKNADAAMYLAKENGRGCYRMFDAQLQGEQLNESAIEPVLCDAVA